jgi:hypothetical protein
MMKFPTEWKKMRQTTNQYIYITKQNYTMWDSYSYRYYNPEKSWFDHVEWDSFMVTPQKVKRGKPGICSEKDMVSM